MALSRTEREQFLAEPHTGFLAVNSEPGRAPLTVPLWYGYEPGGDVWIITGADSRKAKLIADAGRFSLVVQRSAPTERYVSVEGPATEPVPATEQEIRLMAFRYLPSASAEDYLAFAEDFPDTQVLIRMPPEHWLSADMGSF